MKVICNRTSNYVIAWFQCHDLPTLTLAADSPPVHYGAIEKRVRLRAVAASAAIHIATLMVAPAGPLSHQGP